MKRAIIIGASSGIGFEVARLLLDDGWKVGVAARRVDLLQTIGNVSEAERIDVTDPNAAEQLRSMISQLGGMDLFIYTAGIGKQNRELTEGIEVQTTTTNGVGFVRMIGEAYRYFAEKGEGHIVAVTSIAGTKGLGPAPAYSATKAMQNVYIQALEQQAHARGLNIYFTDIRPGFVDTALLNGDFHYPMLMQLFSAKWLMEHRVFRWFWTMLCVSLSAQLGTAPLVCYYFERVACYGLLVNFLVIPLATVIIYLAVAVFVSFFLRIHFVSVFLSQALGGVTSLLNRSLTAVSSWPGACIDHVHIRLPLLLLVYFLLAVLVFVFYRFVVSRLVKAEKNS